LENVKGVVAVAKKINTAYLLNRQIDSLDKDELTEIIHVYRKRLLKALEAVRKAVVEISHLKSLPLLTKRQQANMRAFAKKFTTALLKMAQADRRLREAENRWDEVNYGNGRRSGNILSKKQEWIFGTDLARELKKDRREEAIDLDEEEEGDSEKDDPSIDQED
jgi:hypothetical protein